MDVNGGEDGENNDMMEGIEGGEGDGEEEADEEEVDGDEMLDGAAGAGAVEAASDGEGGGDAGESPDASTDDEGAEHFDISLAASHSYMGTGLQPMSGRCVLEAGWEGSVPVKAHHGAVFPGETVPMLLTHEHDADILTQAIKQDKLFGLLCPDESGNMVSGYGVLCEVFEALLEGGAAPAPSPPAPLSLSFKARATHRFRFKHMPKHALPLTYYTRVRHEKICVLPEIEPRDPLYHSRLRSLDPHRRGGGPADRRLRALDAAGTGWPLFVYDIFDYQRMRAVIRDYFRTLMLEDKLPVEPVSLSFWVARNLALTPRDRLALFIVDSALLRLHMAVRDITRKSMLCCASCATEIARRDNIFAMSSEGVHSNYTNLGGYMHDIVTVTKAVNTILTGGPSAEYSWFPGYTWTIAMCGACMVHVGWRFDAVKRTLRPAQFYGLCRNYVVPRAADTLPLPPLAPFPLPLPLTHVRTHSHSHSHSLTHFSHGGSNHRPPPRGDDDV